MAISPALQKALGQAQNKFSRSSGSRIKPKEGKNTYRLLAPEGVDWLGPNGEFWAELGVHWIKSDPNGKPLAVVGCSSVVYGTPCPIDTAIDLAIQSANDEDSKKLYEEWKARTTVLVNVLDRTEKKDTDGDPEILELTPTTFAKVVEVMRTYAEEGVDITDPKAGLDIIITRSGKGLNTEYSAMVRPGNSKPVDAALVKRAHDLKAHIEKEFFRGEETKALNIIGQISGVALPKGLLGTGSLSSAALAAPRTAAPVATPTPALASAGATVEDADLEAIVEEIETTENNAAPEAPVEEDDEEAALQRQLEEARARKAAKAAAATAAAAPAAAAVETLSADDVDDVLKELEGI